MPRTGFDSCRGRCCSGASSRVPASRESGAAGRQWGARPPAPAAKASRGWKRGRAGCRGPLRALRQYSYVGFGRGEDFLPVLDLVVDGLGGGEKGLVRTLGQQVVLMVELVEDVSGGRAGLNLHIADLAAAVHYD